MKTKIKKGLSLFPSLHVRSRLMTLQAVSPLSILPLYNQDLHQLYIYPQRIGSYYIHLDETGKKCLYVNTNCCRFLPFSLFSLFLSILYIVDYYLINNTIYNNKHLYLQRLVSFSFFFNPAHQRHIGKAFRHM